MNSHALASTILLSLLFAVNTVLFTHRFRLVKSVKCRCEGRSGMPITFASVVPASFSAFACHGALLLPILGLSVLSPLGNLFVAISIGALFLGTLLISKGIANLEKVKN